MSIHIDSEETKPVYQSPTTAEPGEDHGEAEEVGSHVGLKARINLFSGVMIIVGCIIGSGIFISPKGVHENTHSVGWSMVVWVVCGLFSAIGAYCYAELGTFIHSSGGDYAYVLESFGPLMGFLRLWIECIIVRPCTITAVAVTFAHYILHPFFGHCELPAFAPQLLAAGVILVLCQVNCMSVRFVSWVQNIFTMTKLAALALIILTGAWLWVSGEANPTAFKNAFTPTKEVGPGEIALAFYSGLWAYNGWNYLNFIVEELQNPKRNLPLAICISCTICTVVYSLANLAFYAGTTLTEFLESEAIAVVFANKYYGRLAFVMPVLVAGSCFGTVNGVMLTSSRLFFVAGRNGHMPSVLSYINPYWKTPIPAVFFTAFISLLYLLLSDNIYTLINYVQIVNWLAIGIATAGLIWLRVKKPVNEHPRPLQVHLFFPCVFLLGCVFLVVFPIYQAPLDTAIGITIMLTGVPAYFLFVKLQGKLKQVDRLMSWWTISCQKLTLAMPAGKRS